MVNHVGLYGSKVAEGCSAFQRRSCVICIVEILVSSVICRFQGLSYSHVPECIEFSFILFIHHNIHFYFELCTYCNILDIYLS